MLTYVPYFYPKSLGLELETYSYFISESYLEFTFESTGSKGGVLKMARFTKIAANIFNLSFGDLDRSTGIISDSVITNNGDSKGVLITIAAIVHDFSTRYSGSGILAIGITPARNRLYRMGINQYWLMITAHFEVFGLIGNKWEPFKSGNNYTAFFVQNK